MKLSALIIAKDEEINIAKCLDSLQSVVEDVVVIVDSKTTDKTQEVAMRYPNTNCEVREWQGYARSKNYALSKTKNDWVLWIDADEELTQALILELQSFKESQPVYCCYDVARRAYFLGKWIKHCGWYPGRIKRLFNKNHVRFDDRQVHEGLIVEGKVGNLKNDINHYTDPNIEHYFSKFNVYTTLAAKELFSQGKHASLKDILLRPAFIFFKMYFLKKGFLDGLHGFILSVFSSAYVFTKYCKLWELNRNK